MEDDAISIYDSWIDDDLIEVEKNSNNNEEIINIKKDYDKMVINAPIFLIGDHKIKEMATFVLKNKKRVFTVERSLSDIDWWLDLENKSYFLPVCQVVIFWVSTLTTWLKSPLAVLSKQNRRVIFVGNNCPLKGIETIREEENIDTFIKKLEKIDIKLPVARYGNILKRKKPTSSNTEPQNKKENKNKEDTDLRFTYTSAEMLAYQGNLMRETNDTNIYSNTYKTITATHEEFNVEKLKGFDHRILNEFPPTPENYRSSYQAPRLVNAGIKGNVLGFFTWRYLFSNMNTSCHFTINERVYDCVEKYYTFVKAIFAKQYQLADDILANKFSPQECKKATSFKNFGDINHQEWNKIKFNIMYEALKKKYEVEEAKQMLLNTGDALIVELSSDLTWGIGCRHDLIFDSRPTDDALNWRGKNILGLMLMNIRKEIKKGKEITAIKPICELENKLNNIYMTKKEDDLAENNKEKLFKKLENCLNREKGLECELLTFGSTLAKTALKNSDLDIVLYMFDPPEDELETLFVIKRILQKGLKIESASVIRSRLPCLKLSIEGQKVDITIDQAARCTSVFAAVWLRCLGAINIDFRKMCVIIKSWLGELKDGAKGGLNGISIAILIQEYLVKEYQLPNLFRLRPEIYSEEAVQEFLDPLFHEKIGLEISTLYKEGKLSLSSLVKGFFKWLNRAELTKYEFVPLTNEKKPRTETNSSIVIIRDPFCYVTNTAKAMQIQGYQSLNSWLRRTINVIESKDFTELVKLIEEGYKSGTEFSYPGTSSNENGYLSTNKTNHIFKANLQQAQYQPATVRPRIIWNNSNQQNYKSSNESKKSTYFNTKILTVLTFLSLFSFTLGNTPMICHRNTESKFIKISKNKDTCIKLGEMFSNKPVSLALNIYRPEIKEYQFFGSQCSIVKQRAIFWTNILNDPFTEYNQELVRVSREDCLEMSRTKKCMFGDLFGDSTGTMSTGHKLDIKHTFWSLGKSSIEITNCILKNVTILSKPGSEAIYSSIDDLSHCSYSDGSCYLSHESNLIWKILPNSDARRCEFKKFAYRNGTLYKNSWLSEPPDMSLTFDESPPTHTSCLKSLVLSQQGLAIEERSFEAIKREFSSRNKREVPLDGEVRVTQLETQLQARALFEDKEIGRVFRAYSRILCNYIEQAMSNRQYTNPTLLVRKLSKSSFIEGKWINENIIEYWPCSPIGKYRFIASQKCFKYPSINVAIEQEKSIIAFIDPLTLILHANSEEGPCDIYQYVSIFIENSLVRINQLSGESVPIKVIEKVELQSVVWPMSKFNTELQIFRKLIMTNLSQPQIDMMRSFKSLRANSHHFEISTGSSPLSKGGGSSSLEDISPWGLIIGKIDYWLILTRIVVLIILIKWTYKIYEFYLKIKIRGILRKKTDNFSEREIRLATPKPSIKTLEIISGEDPDRIGTITFRNARRSLKRGIRRELSNKH